MSDPNDSKRVTRSQASVDASQAGWLGSWPSFGAAARRQRSRSPSVSRSNLSDVTPPPTRQQSPTRTSTMGDTEGITSALSGLSFSSRKPELPAFDKRNVAIWVRRVENAFIRSNVTLARDKFAFIEAKFGVDADPNINELLYGEATSENWDAFMTYLKTTYGRSVRNKTAAVLDARDIVDAPGKDNSDGCTRNPACGAAAPRTPSRRRRGRTGNDSNPIPRHGGQDVLGKTKPKPIPSGP